MKMNAKKIEHIKSKSVVKSKQEFKHTKEL